MAANHRWSIENQFPLPPDTWERVAQTMRFSPQQKRIVEQMLKGIRQKQIGPALGLAEPTLRTYLKRIYEREGVHDQMDLLLRIMEISHRLDHQDARPL